MNLSLTCGQVPDFERGEMGGMSGQPQIKEDYYSAKYSM